MIKSLESISYDTLDELQATHKPTHPDITRLTDKYGTEVSFQRIMHPINITPRFELSCNYICRRINN